MQTFLFQCLLAASVEVGITNTVSQTKRTLFCEKHKDGEWPCLSLASVLLFAVESPFSLCARMKLYCWTWTLPSQEVMDQNLRVKQIAKSVKTFSSLTNVGPLPLSSSWVHRVQPG